MPSSAEEWRAIPGLTEPYEASSLGRVRSLDRVTAYGRRPGFTRRVRGKVLSQFDNGKYFTVCADGETHSVHVLVTSAFHGPAPTPGLQVRHRDGDGHNNAPENVTWGTGTENQFDRFDHGTACEGEKNYRATLTEREVLLIMSLRNAHGPAAIARKLQRDIWLVKGVVYGTAWNWLTGLPRRRHRKTPLTLSPEGIS